MAVRLTLLPAQVLRSLPALRVEVSTWIVTDFESLQAVFPVDSVYVVVTVGLAVGVKLAELETASGPELGVQL
jgi:hypothetical protein